MRGHLGSRTVLFFVLALLIGLDAMGAELDVRLDRTKVAEGETVQLTLSVAGEGSDTPDLTPLSKDFDVVNQGQSTRLQIVNGRSSRLREWQITLAPKHTGQLRVPALRFGNAVSKPLVLEVLPAAQAAKAGPARPVLLEVEASPNKPYVQGKVVYTARLLFRTALREASLTDPTARGAIVERLGEDKKYDTYRDGQSYQVIERRYAIFPQHSGRLQIEPPVLTAQVAEPGRRSRSARQRFFGGRDPFADFDRMFGGDPFSDMDSMFEAMRPMQLRGRRVTLDVQPQPAGTPTPWLPAESVTLSEAWSPDPPEFRVGEPVTRTIAITAQGVTAAQLPDIPLDTVSGIRIYPDKAQVETRPNGDTLIAQKVFKAALVPSRPGRYTLPEIRLSWWDADNGKLQVARLPARQIEVQPGVAATSSPIEAPARVATQGDAVSKDVTVPARLEAATAKGPAKPRGSTTQAIGDAGYWPWLALMFALAWLISTGLWWRARSSRVAVTANDTATVVGRPSAGKALRRLEQACRNDDARAARRALLDWAAARWPERPPRRLEDLVGRLPAPAEGLLTELDRQLYADAGPTWNGTDAWRQLAQLLREAGKSADRKAPDTPLPPLYPQGT